MTGRRPDREQLNLFVTHLTDVPLRDQQDTMERPFVSLSKSKRVAPIEYQVGGRRQVDAGGDREAP